MRTHLMTLSLLSSLLFPACDTGMEISEDNQEADETRQPALKESACDAVASKATTAMLSSKNKYYLEARAMRGEDLARRTVKMFEIYFKSSCEDMPQSQDAQKNKTNCHKACTSLTFYSALIDIQEDFDLPTVSSSATSILLGEWLLGCWSSCAEVFGG